MNTMMQVRWTIGDYAVRKKDKKRRAANFNPLADKKLAHKFFDTVAQELPKAAPKSPNGVKAKREKLREFPSVDGSLPRRALAPEDAKAPLSALDTCVNNKFAAEAATTSDTATSECGSCDYELSKQTRVTGEYGSMLEQDIELLSDTDLHCLAEYDRIHPEDIPKASTDLQICMDGTESVQSSLDSIDIDHDLAQLASDDCYSLPNKKARGEASPLLHANMPLQDLGLRHDVLAMGSISEDDMMRLGQKLNM